MKRKFSIKDAKWVARVMNAPLDGFTYADLATGMTVELEHGSKGGVLTDVTNDDPVTTAQIALAHLYEYPDYYKRLLKAGLMDKSEVVRENPRRRSRR